MSIFRRLFGLWSAAHRDAVPVAVETGVLLSGRVEAVDWDNLQTAYGPASNVPSLLIALGSSDQERALHASHLLWCSLCHQHAYVSSAALPALPFILEVLDSASEKLSIEILDILLGFARCTVYHDGFEAWESQLREDLLEERQCFERLAKHSNSEIADFATTILEELSTPNAR